MFHLPRQVLVCYWKSDFCILHVVFFCFNSNTYSVFIFSSFQRIVSPIGIPFVQENNQNDFSFSLTLFEKKCLPKPKLLLYHSIIPLAAILLTLFVMALMASKVVQIRLLVCERFFSTATEARVEYLHAKILRKRSKTKRMSCLTSLRFKVRITAYVRLWIFMWRRVFIFPFVFLFQLHFWCPLLFKPPEEPQSIAWGSWVFF